MHAKKITLTPELHRQLVAAIAAILGIRDTIAEKTFETFLSEILERLADEPALLKELLSSGSEKNSRRSRAADTGSV